MEPSSTHTESPQSESTSLPAPTENGASAVDQAADQVSVYVAQARTWVKDHPTGALLIAAGAGLIVGRFLADALTPPPTRLERLRHEAHRLADQARGAADQARSAAAGAGGALAYRAGATADAAGEQFDRLKEAIPSQDAVADLFESVGQAVHQGVVRGVERKLSEWGERLPFIK